MSAEPGTEQHFRETMRKADEDIQRMARQIGAMRAILALGKLPPSAQVHDCILAIEAAMGEISR